MLRAAAARHDSMLCVGLDPEPAKFPVAQAGMAPADDKIKSMEATVGELQQRAAELTQKLELAAATPTTTPAAGQPPQPEARPAQPASWCSTSP